MDQPDLGPELAEDVEPSFGDPANPEPDWNGTANEIASAETRPEGNFRAGDKVKFQVFDAVPEAGRYFLPPIRDRVFLAIAIVERNGEPSSQSYSLECGVHTDELPAGKRMSWKDGKIDLVGLDTSRYWTGTLVRGGLPRIRPEDIGGWIQERAQPFIDGATLVMTEEPAPPGAPVEKQLHPHPTFR